MAALFTILSCFSPLDAGAQENDGLVYPNTFFGSVSVGAFSFARHGESTFSLPAANLSGGVWLTEPLAFQVSADAITGSGISYLALLSAEIKWDVNATFFHRYNKNFLSPLPFYPILGLGADFGAFGDDSQWTVDERSFHIMLGLQVPYRIASHIDAILQYKCFFLPQGFNNSFGDNYLHTVSLGLLFRQSKDPFHRRTEHYTRNIAEDWFFGLGIGPNYSGFDLFHNPYSGGSAMFGIAPEIFFGRNFSNFWSVRIALGGLTAHESFDTVLQAPKQDYRYSFLHADLMLNVSNLILRGRGVTFNAMPYLGAGPVWRYDEPLFNVAMDFGLLFRYYLTRHSDIYLDCRYVVVPPAIGGGTGPSGDYFGVSLPSITLGYIYNFGQNSTRYRMPLNWSASRL